MSCLSTGRTYKITCETDLEWSYVGSTFLPLSKRFSKHKTAFRKWLRGEIKHKCECFPHFAEFGLESHRIELLQEYDVIRTHARDHKHLNLFETLWIDRIDGCCNKHRPFRPFSKVLSKAKADRLGITQCPAVLAARNEYLREWWRERMKDPEVREARREYRREYWRDPEVRRAHNERERKVRKERKASDPEYAERQRAYMRDYLARKKSEDPEFAEKERERLRDYRARKDPEVRAADNERASDRRKERRATDPEWAEKERERCRAYRARKKAEAEEKSN